MIEYQCVVPNENTKPCGHWFFTRALLGLHLLNDHQVDEQAMSAEEIKAAMDTAPERNLASTQPDYRQEEA